MRIWGWHRSSDGSVWCTEHAHLGTTRDRSGAAESGGVTDTLELPSPPVADPSAAVADPGPAAAALGPATAPTKTLASRGLGRRWAWGALAVAALCCCGGVFVALLNPDPETSESQAADSVATSSAVSTLTASSEGGDEVTAGEVAPTAGADRAETTTVVVTNVIDGDTVDVSTGHRIRLIGIDTPERGECGYDQATAHLASLVSGKQVTLISGARDDADRYGRLLRYIEVDNIDVGLEQIKAGYAIARYDSRDGYGAHPREQTYIAADHASPNYTCADPPRATMPPPPVQTPPPAQPPAQPTQSNCHPSYVPCVPNVPYDLDCSDIGFWVTVVGPDVYRLDSDGDTIGCESYR
jgi:endonuclease YncB( thermonuclease family)